MPDHTTVREAKGNARTLELGEALGADGEMVPAYGYTIDGDFIVDPYVSACGRFDAAPSSYGLTDVEAAALVRANKGKGLLAA